MPCNSPITGMEEDRSLYSQVHFSGESKCAKFVPNPFKCNICTACLKEISKHSKDAVENEEMLMKVKKNILCWVCCGL